MRSERRVGHSEAIHEFAVGEDDNFLGKPLSAEKDGERIARRCHHDKTFPRIAAATAFDTGKLPVELLQRREAYEAAGDALLDLFALLVVAADSALTVQQFIITRKGNDARA